jgi:hypothetical protein
LNYFRQKCAKISWGGFPDAKLVCLYLGQYGLFPDWTGAPTCHRNISAQETGVDLPPPSHKPRHSRHWAPTSLQPNWIDSCCIWEWSKVIPTGHACLDLHSQLLKKSDCIYHDY